MRCPECNEEVRDGARFCHACGSPLRPAASGGATGGDPAPPDTAPAAPRGRWLVPLAASVAAVATALVAVYVAVAIGRGGDGRGPVRDDAADSAGTFQFVEGQGGTAQMSVRVPKGSGDATVYDEDGNAVAVLRQADMEDSGDGYMVGVVDVPVDTSSEGERRYVARAGDAPGASAREGEGSGESAQPNKAKTKASSKAKEKSNSKGNSKAKEKGEDSDEGEPSAGGELAGECELVVDVIPSVPVPVVGQGQDWVLARACDWVDSAYGDAGTGAGVAKALARHLGEDEGVRVARAYGSAVMFTNADGVLHCIDLAPAADGMLGAAGDGGHSFADADPAIDAFETYRDGGEIGPGAGITAGNAVTSGDVLLLEPTPDLMDRDVSEEVRRSCGAYAASMEGSLDARAGDDALPAILSGDLCGPGVVVLRAHGIGADGAGASLLQMRSRPKERLGSWEDVGRDLAEYVGSIEDGSMQRVWPSFRGDAADAGGWCCAVTARSTGEEGRWDVGVSVTTNLIERYYQGGEFEQSIIWLSACGGLADGSFADYALGHGAQIVQGYEGPVSEEDDARSLCEMLDGLTSGSAEGWRGRNAGEALEGSAAEGAASGDGAPTASGNLELFAQGTGTLGGRVVTGGGESLPDAEVEAWRYYGNTFTSCGTATTDGDGAFSMEGIPCGRYVVEASAGGGESVATVVLDEESVDGGDLELGGGDAAGEGEEPDGGADADERDGEAEQKKEAAGKGSPKNTTSEDKKDSLKQVDVGVGNWGVTADSKYFYICVNPIGGYGTDEDGATPRIVRVNKKDYSDSKIIWKSKERGELHQLEIYRNRLYVFNKTDASGQILSMNADGKDVKEIVGGTQLADMYSNKLFTIANNRMLFVSTTSDKWQLSSCKLNGTSIKELYAGTLHSSSKPELLSVTDDRAIVTVPTAVDEGRPAVAVCSIELDGSKTIKELLTYEFGRTIQVSDNRILKIEDNDLVSYPIERGDRSVIGSMPSKINSGSVWNANSQYAFVFGYADENSESGLWRISLNDGDAVNVAEEMNGLTVNLADDVVIATYIGGEAEIWDYDFNPKGKIDVSKEPSTTTESSTADPGSLVKERASTDVAWIDTADYDGDGTKETFAITGEWYGTSSTGHEAWSKPVLWFVSSKGNVSEVYQLRALGYVNGVFDDPGNSGYRLLSIESSAGGSGSGSIVFGVKDGKAVEVDASGRDLQLENGKLMTAHDEYITDSGHKLNWYELHFDAKKFALVEDEYIGMTGLFETPE